MPFMQAVDVDEITNFIVNQTEALCDCGFASENIPDGQLMCFQNDSLSITYRGTLLETTSTNTSQLAAFIGEWSGSAALDLPELGIKLTVDNSCAVVVSSASEEECLLRPVEPEPSEKPGLSERNRNIIIGVVVGVGGLLLILLLLICCCCCCCCCRKDSSVER